MPVNQDGWAEQFARQRELNRVDLELPRAKILKALEAGALTFPGLVRMTGLEAQVARRALDSLRTKGHVHDMRLQRPRRAAWRHPKRSMRIYWRDPR